MKGGGSNPKLASMRNIYMIALAERAGACASIPHIQTSEGNLHDWSNITLPCWNAGQKSETEISQVVEEFSDEDEDDEELPHHDEDIHVHLSIDFNAMG